MHGSSKGGDETRGRIGRQDNSKIGVRNREETPPILENKIPMKWLMENNYIMYTMRGLHLKEIFVVYFYENILMTYCCLYKYAAQRQLNCLFIVTEITG